MVATSYWPPWLEKSWLILSRTSFSGSTVKLTLMPVSFVKCAAVSFCNSIICGLFTMSTLIVSPPEPVPPAPAHAVLVARRAAVTAATRMRVPRPRCRC